MGLLKKKDKEASGKLKSRLSGGGGSGSQISALRPRYVESLPPCTGNCPSGNDIRGWLTVIALREKLGLSLDEACERAFRIEMETNPFPSVMGRVCPHPCESFCNRKDKDGAVAINSVERFIGDWALDHGLKAERIEGEGPKQKKVAVIGAGPVGTVRRLSAGPPGLPGDRVREPPQCRAACCATASPCTACRARSSMPRSSASSTSAWSSSVTARSART